MKLGLRSKIILSAALIIVFTTASIAATATWLYVSHHVETLQSRSSAVARSLAFQLERITSLGISVDDIVGFEEQCEEAVRSYPGVAFAQIVGPEGEILFDNRSGLAGQSIESRILLETLQRESEQVINKPMDGHYLVMSPVRNTSGSRLATVIVGFPASLVDEAVTRTLALGGLVGILVAGVGLLALYMILQRFVIRPISSLVDAVSHVRANPGDYSVRVPEQNDDELGVLVNGFNQLLGNIQEREQELILARDASDKANRMKSDFLAAMSHDLRTPMHAILSMNELLRGTELTDKQRRYAFNVQKAGQWLLGIINDILAFAKIEAGKLELLPAPFDLRQLVEDTLMLQEDFARSKSLELSFRVAPDLPRQMVGDGPRLMQMLTNLLSNAIKFTDSGSIHLDVIQANNCVAFSVTDTGIGIDAEKIEQLFEPFVQVATPDGHRRSGSGLGLSIVKQLAEAMGGEVGVDSAPRNGATFWFTARLEGIPNDASCENDSDLQSGSYSR
jgi:two-component system, sensor histidine kinase